MRKAEKALPTVATAANTEHEMANSLDRNSGESEALGASKVFTVTCYCCHL